MGAHFVFGEHEHRRRILEPRAGAYVGNTIAQRILHSLEQFFLFLAGFGQRGLFCLGRERAELEIAPNGVLELLALEVIELAHHPLVDAVAEQQHFDTVLLELLDVRARACGIDAVGDDEIDALLAFLHSLDVLLQADRRLVALFPRARESQQRQDLVAVRAVFSQTFLQDGAEFLPHGLVLVRLVARDLGERFEHATGQTAANRLDLQDPAGAARARRSAADRLSPPRPSPSAGRAAGTARRRP